MNNINKRGDKLSPRNFKNMTNIWKKNIISSLSLGVTFVLMIFIFRYKWDIFTLENNNLLYAFILILFLNIVSLCYGLNRRGIKIKEGIIMTMAFIFLLFVEIMLFFHIESLSETIFRGDTAIARVISISYEREERVKIEYYENDKSVKKQAYLPLLSNVSVGDDVNIKYLKQQNNEPIIIKSTIGLFISILLLIIVFLFILLILYAIILLLFQEQNYEHTNSNNLQH